MKAADYVKGRENNVVRAQICLRRRLKMPSATECRQLSWLFNCSPEDICMPALRVNSDLLHLMKRIMSTSCKLRFVTPDKENNVNTLWQEKE